MDRCFIGIKVPEISSYFNSVSTLSDDLDVKLSAVNPTKYHLTLHFFGDITVLEQSKIINYFSNFEFSCFEITLDGTNTLPPNNPKKTKVLYINISDGGAVLQELVNTIQFGLKELNFPIPTRKFLPHLTIARVKYGREIITLSNVWKSLKFDPRKLLIDEFSLIKSDLTPQGAVYTTLNSFKLQ